MQKVKSLPNTKAIKRTGRLLRLGLASYALTIIIMTAWLAAKGQL